MNREMSSLQDIWWPLFEQARLAWKSAKANWKQRVFSKVAQEVQMFVEFILKARIMQNSLPVPQHHDLKKLAWMASGFNEKDEINRLAVQMEARATKGRSLSVSTRYSRFDGEKFDPETIPDNVYNESEAIFLCETALRIYNLIAEAPLS